MDGVVDTAPPLGAWASIRGFFTPATLFLVVNLVIGTIALTSRATQQRRRRDRNYQYQYHHDDGHLHHDPLHPHMQPPQHEYHHQHHYYPQEQAAMYAPPPLARTSSVLDRLRSFGLYRFRSGDFPPEYAAAAGPPNHAHDAFAPVVESEQPQAHHARSRSEPAPQPPAREERRPAAARASKAGSEVRRSQAAARAPAARVVEEAVAENDDYVGAARVAEETAVVGSFRRREPSPLQQEDYHHYQEEEEYVPPVRAPVAPAPLQRTSSVLDRLRSLGLYGFLAPEQPAAVPVPESGQKQHAHYDRSRSEPARELQQGGKKKEKKQEAAKTRMAKSSSAARKATSPSPAATGEGVDARAEAFIDSFRQQQVQHHHKEQEEYVPPPAPLPRTSSVLDRLRSFGLYRFRSGDLGPDNLPTAAAETHTPAAEEKKKKKQEAQYGRSRSEPAREQGKREPRMSKSSSSVVEEEEHEAADHGVDARADDFINKFRHQLQLQRLNSLLDYKEMLGRGGAAGKQ